MEEKTLYLGSVVYPLNQGKIILAFKTKKIGANCWNGYGGGTDEGESIEESAIRELEEESGLTGKTENLKKIAIVDFHNTKTDGSQFVSEIHFYTLTDTQGKPRDTETMINPTEFEINKLPFEKMMPADKFWLPRALNGEQIYVVVHYGPYQKELLKPIEVYPISEYSKKKELIN